MPSTTRTRGPVAKDQNRMNYKEINTMLYDLVHDYVRRRMDNNDFVDGKTFTKKQALCDFSDFMKELAASEGDHGCKED